MVETFLSLDETCTKTSKASSAKIYTDDPPVNHKPEPNQATDNVPEGQRVFYESQKEEENGKKDACDFTFYTRYRYPVPVRKRTFDVMKKTSNAGGLPFPKKK